MHRLNVNNGAKSLLMTIDEVAQELRLGRTRAYALVSSGDLPSVRVGRSRRVRRSDVEAFVERLGNGPDAA